MIEKHFKRFLIGQDPFNIELIWDQMNRTTLPYGLGGFTGMAMARRVTPTARPRLLGAVVTHRLKNGKSVALGINGGKYRSSASKIARPEKVAEEWPNILSSKATSKCSKKVRTASKTTAAYWSGKIRLEKKPGWKSSNYFVRIQAHGTRRKMKLDSTIREESAREAAALYIDILAKGWPQEDSALLSLPGGSSLPENPTIEDWVTAVTVLTERSIKDANPALVANIRSRCFNDLSDLNHRILLKITPPLKYC